MKDLRETAPAYEPVKPLPQGKISFEEFLAWCDEDTWAEWVDGEVVLLTPAARKHQRTVRFLIQLLGLYVEKKDLGELLFEPFLVRLPVVLRRGRAPDLIFIRKERLHLLKETYFDGAPDLIIEIISPESYNRDKIEKYHEYEAAGVKEYWLIDPDSRQAEFFRLDKNGRYRLFTPDEEGIYCAEVLPGFWLKTHWLWQEPLPSIITVLKEMGEIKF